VFALRVTLFAVLIIADSGYRTPAIHVDRLLTTEFRWTATALIATASLIRINSRQTTEFRRTAFTVKVSLGRKNISLKVKVRFYQLLLSTVRADYFGFKNVQA